MTIKIFALITLLTFLYRNCDLFIVMYGNQESTTAQSLASSEETDACLTHCAMTGLSSCCCAPKTDNTLTHNKEIPDNCYITACSPLSENFSLDFFASTLNEDFINRFFNLTPISPTEIDWCDGKLKHLRDSYIPSIFRPPQFFL